MIEFWAVATRPVDVNGLGWSSTLTEAEIQQLRLQFSILDDRSDMFPVWLQLVKQYEEQGKNVHGARLVAIMQTHNISHLLTFNVADFQRFDGITVVHPSDVQSYTDKKLQALVMAKQISSTIGKQFSGG